MKIKWIEKVKLFLENRKLKKMSDGALIKELNERLLAEETESIPNIVGFVEDDNKQLDVAKELIESKEVTVKTKKQVIQNLPQQTQKELFRKSIKTKEVLAQKDISTFLKILIKDKNLQPYDELYYRIDKAFSDSQLANILEQLQKERPESYNEEKITQIITKQIVVDIKKYGSFLPSHLENLTSKIIINDEKQGKRKFDILEEKDRRMLETELEKASQELKENKKNPITEVEEQRITSDKLKLQIEQMAQFAQRRQEELRLQGIENARKQGHNR